MEWRAFELHPEIPPDGMRLPDPLRERWTLSASNLIRMAHEVGLAMTPEIGYIPNSRLALETAEYAREKGRHQFYHEAVFARYFAQGQNIGDWAILLDIAEKNGLDGLEMQQRVLSGAYRAAVNSQIKQARRLGIKAVPAFVFDNRYAILGAKPYSVFQDLMARIVDRNGDSLDAP